MLREERGADPRGCGEFGLVGRASAGDADERAIREDAESGDPAFFASTIRYARSAASRGDAGRPPCRRPRVRHEVRSPVRTPHLFDQST